MAFDKVVDSAKLDATFTAIADAIREKKGSTAVFTPEQMPAAIAGIQGGGGVPMIETGATDKPRNLVLVNVEFSPGGRAVKSHYEYNGIQFPAIPSGASGYSYLTICRYNKPAGDDVYYLYAHNNKGYCFFDSALTSSGLDVYTTPAGNYVRWTYEGGVWGSMRSYSAAQIALNMLNYGLVWTNYDVPYGSATATEIYFEGSEPVLVEE